LLSSKIMFLIFHWHVSGVEDLYIFELRLGHLYS